MMRKVMTDPNDLTRLSDGELLGKIMNLAVEMSDYKRQQDHVGYAAARKVTERILTEAKRRMMRGDPVLRGARG